MLVHLNLAQQVISEGLRYMCLSHTSRYCTESYKIPDSDFTIPKGMKVIIPTVSIFQSIKSEINSSGLEYDSLILQNGLHFDPDYWTNPETFDPERFSTENKSKLVTGAFQPFGFGPK